jgi:hypothetical protein
MPIIAIALVLAAALGGETAYLAQTSLPGDVLWGFKTSINEPLRGALTQGDQAKAQWDVAVVLERLAEASRLAAQGRLDAAAQAQVTSSVDQHARDVAALVAKLQSEGKLREAADVAAHFQSALATAAASLGSAVGTPTTTSPIVTHVRSTLDAAASLSADAEHEREGSDD